MKLKFEEPKKTENNLVNENMSMNERAGYGWDRRKAKITKNYKGYDIV